MSEEYRQAIEAWRNRLGAGKPFHEQELWKTSIPQGPHNHVGWCSMDKRLAIKRILIAGLRARLVEVVGPGQWSIVE